MNRLIFASLIIGVTLTSSFTQTPSKHAGIELYQQGKYAEAVRSLEAARKKSPFKSDPEIWKILGLAHGANEDNAKAVKALEKAVDLAPESSAYRANLAVSYLTNGVYAKAREQAQKSVELDPRNVIAYQVRGFLSFGEKQPRRRRIRCQKNARDRSNLCSGLPSAGRCSHVETRAKGDDRRSDQD